MTLQQLAEAIAQSPHAILIQSCLEHCADTFDIPPEDSQSLIGLSERILTEVSEDY